MLCPKCGAENDESAATCVSCGESLKGEMPAAEAAEPTPEETAVAEAPTGVSLLGWLAVIVVLLPWVAMILVSRQSGDLDTGLAPRLLWVMTTPYVAIAAVALLIIAAIHSSMSTVKRRLTVPAMLVIILALAHIAYTFVGK